MGICEYVLINVFTAMLTNVCTKVHTGIDFILLYYIHIDVCIYEYIHTCIHLYIRMYLCTYVHMCVYVLKWIPISVCSSSMCKLPKCENIEFDIF